jgi:hypothetical protein
MFEFLRKARPAQTPVHPLNQFATVLTAAQLAQYEAGKRALVAAGLLDAETDAR